MPLPTSDSLQILVNKQHPLQPKTYVPSDLTVPDVLLAAYPDNSEMQLRLPAAIALAKLFQAASSNNIYVMLSSGYRSYDDQNALYTALVSQLGSSATDEVAPPGTSEHQTGLAADIIAWNYFCPAQACFALTHAAAWLESNAYRYGFILRYPAYKQAITGYEYEPWHYRYVGIKLATRLHQTGLTLEEYYVR
jgi:D-alanyl-D-alanine carboxypeptidase